MSHVAPLVNTAIHCFQVKILACSEKGIFMNADVGTKGGTGKRAPRFRNEQRSALFMFRNAPFFLRKNVLEVSCPQVWDAFYVPVCKNSFYQIKPFYLILKLILISKIAKPCNKVAEIPCNPFRELPFLMLETGVKEFSRQAGKFSYAIHKVQ